jgi:hypothetical protein
LVIVAVCGPVGAAGRQQLAAGQVAQLVADRVGCGDDQRMQLVERLGAGLVRGPMHDLQGAQRFHRSVVRLGLHLGLAADHGSGRGDRIDGVGLAVRSADLPVGAVDLDHANALVGQMPGQAGSVGAGALDPDDREVAERRQEPQQPPIAGRGRGERAAAEQAAELVAGRCDVDVRVSVHAADDSDTSRCQSCHASPLTSDEQVGHARASGRTGQGRGL